MKTIKVSEATNIQLDWLVAKCEGQAVTLDVSLPNYPLLVLQGEEDRVDDVYSGYSPTTDWSQGGPIIEREGIELHTDEEVASTAWSASHYNKGVYWCYGATPLIAAMRCYCCVKRGDVVEVPEELLCADQCQTKQQENTK